MKAKLTLSVEEGLVEKAKRHAEARGTSVSKLVERYFSLMGQQAPAADRSDNSAFTRSLRGIVSDREVTEEDYYRYLEEKHG